MAEPTRVAVTDTSPLIALCALGHLVILESLFERVIVPFAVWEELVDREAAPEPSLVRALGNVRFEPGAELGPAMAPLLGAGEREVLALAQTMPGVTVLLDEIRARRAARRLGLHAVGTIGLLVQAKRERLIEALAPELARLKAHGFRIGDDLIATTLRENGEGTESEG